MTKTVCQRCAIDYPTDLVAAFFNGQAYEPLCGICALQRMNATHGTRYKSFHGPAAEAKRQAALAFRATVAR